MVVSMTAAAVKPPFANASPAEIRGALLPEERPDFDREYRRALEVAAESLTLDELHETLGCWRRVAWMTHSDPAAHRWMLRTAAERLTGEEISADEPLARTKARLGL
jgi:hypothetical protein